MESWHFANVRLRINGSLSWLNIEKLGQKFGQNLRQKLGQKLVTTLISREKSGFYDKE